MYGDVWNRDHPAVKGLNQAAWNWVWTVMPPELDPSPHAAEILDDPARACAWLMRIVTTYWSQELPSRWEAFAERGPELMKRIWRKIFGDETSPFVVATMFTRLTLKIITATQWREIEISGSDRALIEQYLPEPTSTIRIMGEDSGGVSND